MSRDAIISVHDTRGTHVASFYCRYNCYLEEFVPAIRAALNCRGADQVGIDYIPAFLISGLLPVSKQIKLVDHVGVHDGSYIHHIKLQATNRFCEQGVPRSETFHYLLSSSSGVPEDFGLLHEWEFDDAE